MFQCDPELRQKHERLVHFLRVLTEPPHPEAESAASHAVFAFDVLTLGSLEVFLCRRLTEAYYSPLHRRSSSMHISNKVTDAQAKAFKIHDCQAIRQWILVRT